MRGRAGSVILVLWMCAAIGLPAWAAQPSAEPALISEDHAAALAVNNLEAVDGGYALHHPGHRAVFGSQGIEVSPRSGALVWRWRLERLGAGASAASLIDAAPMQPSRPEALLLRYDRTVLDEEYVLGASTIEQRFILHVPPPLGGQDLVLEGSVTCDGDFLPGATGWEWRGDGGFVWLGPATVFDANGTAIASKFTVSASATRLVVDGEALAAAAYPVTIDPEIGANDFRISDMGGTGDPQYEAWEAAVAYNSTNNEYLVVWSGEDNSGGLVANEYEIYGQRLNAATGAEIGTNDFRISDLGGTGDPDWDGVAPAAAYNSTNNQYLVVWQGNDNVGGLVEGEWEIFGQRLNAATGAEVGTNDFRISDMGPDGDVEWDPEFPAVAYNSTNNEYLVVWTSDEFFAGALTNDELEIWGQRLNAATGAEVGANDFRISDMGGIGDPDYDAGFADVAYNLTGNQYLVAWRGEDNVGGLVNQEWEIFGQRLNAATGAEVGTNDFRISDLGGTGSTSYGADSWPPSVAYDGTDGHYIVVWVGTDNVGGLVSNEHEVFSQLLDAGTGAEVGANDSRISDMGGIGNASYWAYSPGVTFDTISNQFLVVWSGEDNVGGLVDNEYEVFGQQLDAETGAEVGVNDFRISDLGGVGGVGYAAREPDVAFSGANNEFLAVWHGDDNVGGLVDDEKEIFGQRLTSGLFSDGFESGNTAAWSLTVP